MQQQINYRYKALDARPIIVEVLNTMGERVTEVLYPWIVTKPDPICTTELICPEPIEPTSNSTNATNATSNGTNGTNATDGGRRLQQTQNQTRQN